MDERILARKLKLWQNRLLDLSKRNRMISLKDSNSQVIRLDDPGFEELYQTLVIDGHSMQIKRPLDRIADPAVYTVMRLMHHLSEQMDVGKGTIRTSGTLEASARIVRNIKKYADLSLQEKGTNILYLSFGFLYWRDRDTRGVWLKAPLILVPASLTQPSLYQPFDLRKTEEEIIVNPTFSYFLEINHGIHLPELRSYNKVQSIYEFLDQVSTLVEKQGWRVEREVYLSTMSFLKTNMYNDLVENEARIMSHPVIRAFAGERSASTTLPESDTDFRHDTTDVESVFEVLNADSSQKDAVELSRRGISFVMQGPPGTGKSQTITNIIAQGLAEGKKILFVSEKQAALDVVYHRLHDVGIANLCLPLHDPKTGKQLVLNQLETNLDAPKTKVGNERIAELHQLDGLKTELNDYVQLLHQKILPLNLSLYDAYQMLFSLSDVDDLPLSLPNLSVIDRAGMNRMIREIIEYESCRESLGEGWYSHPWLGIKKNHLSNTGKQRLKESISTLLKNLEGFCGFEITQKKNLADVITWNNCQTYESIGRLLAESSVVPESMVMGDGIQEEEAYPKSIMPVLEELELFYRESRPVILRDTDKLKSQSLFLAELFEKLDSLLLKTDGLSDQLSYLLIFQIRELMYQFGLDMRNLSVTEYYFNNEGIESVYRLKAERISQFRRSESIHSELLKRYSEDVFAVSIVNEEGQIPVLLEQIRHLNDRKSNELLRILETECGIRVIDKSNTDELYSAVKALLDGVFDIFTSLSENEFYYVYDLLEEACLKEAAGDGQWFIDYGTLLYRYTGQKAASAKSGIWEKLIVLANDFYYIKTSYPELMRIVHLRNEDKKRLQKKLTSMKTEKSVTARIVNELCRVSLSGQGYSIETICDDIQRIVEYKAILAQAEISYLDDVKIIGKQYLMASTDWELVEQNILFAKELSKLFSKREVSIIKKLLDGSCSLDWDEINAVLNQILVVEHKIPSIETLSIQSAINVLKDNAMKLDRIKEKTSEWRQMRDIAIRIRGAAFHDGALVIDKEVFHLMLDNDSRKLFDIMDRLCELKVQAPYIIEVFEVFEEPEALMDMSVSNLYKRLTSCLARFNEYDTMVEYQVSAEHCRKDGLNAFINLAHQVLDDKKPLGKTFEKAFLTAWIDMVSASREIISAFSARAQKNKIQTFSVLDKKQLAIARERVLSNSFERMPSRSAGKVVGEMGILLREISKSRNAMSIRQLFNSIPNLLTVLKPCLMMSPLSVAYFLKADLYSFDLVIFDEASQIYPENAIGAILRGKQVIISGDSKQMPPTSFFQTALGSEEEDEEDDIAASSDSILVEAENALPNLSLTWHYRSRNESLITFSNRNMYSGSLVTFPNNAPSGPDNGVEYMFVENGVYENRCNVSEAEACVALTIKHFQTHPERSIGIIAFSLSQEECIERAFDEYRVSHPQFEHFFDENRENPFFVKNLENVQGDERDTILLSVGYGKNAQGVLRYNFGPLGMQGGERRMNVAITRAKYNIKLVTSLKPEDFDRAKTVHNAGAKLLFDYIVYAIHGPRRDTSSTSMISGEGFKQYILQVLWAAGYETAVNIGNSGYKVEIAVQDPEHPESYIVGIETDGWTYQSARTVRDRECLRPDMLRNMGWDMYRVWSTQWIRDPETEKKKLLQYIAQRIAEKKQGESI